MSGISEKALVASTRSMRSRLESKSTVNPMLRGKPLTTSCTKSPVCNRYPDKSFPQHTLARTDKPARERTCSCNFGLGCSAATEDSLAFSTVVAGLAAPCFSDALVDEALADGSPPLPADVIVVVADE